MHLNRLGMEVSMVSEGRNRIERRERNIRGSQSFADFAVAKLTEDVLPLCLRTHDGLLDSRCLSILNRR